MTEVRRKVKELDHWLKDKIVNSITDVSKYLESNDNKPHLYYTGNFQKDVLDNYTERQSNKIFKKFRKLQSVPNVIFYQKKSVKFKDADGDEWSGYDYYVRKI